MLHALRRGAKTWIAKALLILLVFSFAIWGVADFVGGIGQNTVVKVGDEEIGAREFQIAYQSQVNTLQRQFNTAITPDMAQMFGIPQRVIAGLAATATVNGIAADLNLGISQDQLIRQIGERYAPTGFFDRTQMALLLQQNGMTEAEFIHDERQAASREQLLSGLSGGVQIPDIYVSALYDFDNEQRVVSFVTVTRRDVSAPAEPSAGDLEAYFAENAGSYRAPEYRGLRVLHLDPADIADETLVSDDEIRAAYDAAGDRFQTTETRRVYQLLTDSLEDAEAVVARLAGGASFETVVAQSGKTLSDVDLGVVSRSDILDPAIANVAFALAPNSNSEAVDARFGGAVVRVTDVNASVQTPFEAVAPALRQELAIERAEEDSLALFDDIEDARAGGAPLDEVADRFSLDLIEIAAVSRAGASLEGALIIDDIPGGEATLEGAFSSDVGLEEAPIEITRTSFAFYEVSKIIPARPQDLDEVKGRVVADWRADQIDQAIADLADEIATDLTAGRDMASLGARHELTIATAGPFTRNDEVPEGLTSTALASAFDGAEKHVAIADGEGGSQIVLQVTQILRPAFFGEADGNDERAEELKFGLENGLIDQFIQIEQNRLGVEVNQQLIDQLLNPQETTNQGGFGL